MRYLTILAIFYSINLFGQDNFPKKLEKEEKYTNNTDSTVWLISHSQFNKTIKTAQLSELQKKEIVFLNSKIDQQAKIIEGYRFLDSLSMEGYQRYVEKWESGMERQMELEIKNEKYKQQRKLFGIGGFGLGILLMLLI